MGLRWAYTAADGRVSIVQAMPKADLEPLIGTLNDKGDMVLSDKEYYMFVYNRSIPETATNVIELADDVVLPSREYRDAWEVHNGAIRINPDKKAAVMIPRIKEEAQRRIIKLTGQSNLISSMIKQSNSNMRATELNDKRVSGIDLSPAEVIEADALRELAVSIKSIRAASNNVEAELPDDYTDDRHWPELS